MELTKLYFESHITIEPVFEEKLEEIKTLAATLGFRVADLLMQKRKHDKPERSKYDTFYTGRNEDYYQLRLNTLNLVDLLEAAGFRVFRYKIEDTILDSKVDDSIRPLSRS